MGCKPAYPNLPFDSKPQLSASWTTHPSLLKASLLTSHKNKGSCRRAIFQAATFLLPGHSFHRNLSLLPGLFSKSLLLVSNSFFFFSLHPSFMDFLFPQLCCFLFACANLITQVLSILPFLSSPFLTHHSLRTSLPISRPQQGSGQPLPGSEGLLNSHQCPFSPWLFFQTPLLVHKAFVDHNLSLLPGKLQAQARMLLMVPCPLPH